MMPTQFQKGQRFPDLCLPDHTGQVVRLSELAAPDEFSQRISFDQGRPLIVVFYRGFFCPRDRMQLSQLVSFYPEVALNQVSLVAISVDAPMVAAAYRAGLGAVFPFLSDQERTAIQQLDIVDNTDGEYPNVAIPYTFCLTPELTIDTIYTGWWLAGRPTVEELRRDIRALRHQLDDYTHAAWDTSEVKAVRIPAASWDGQTPGKTWRTVGKGRGRVQWFARGQGSIESEHGEELFVHFSGIPGQGDRMLQPGAWVEFVIAEEARGRYAVDVKVIERLEKRGA
jgi:peroxiredoxin/cold shock CspA family protein